MENVSKSLRVLEFIMDLHFISFKILLGLLIASFALAGVPDFWYNCILQESVNVHLVLRMPFNVPIFSVHVALNSLQYVQYEIPASFAVASLELILWCDFKCIH